MRFDVITIFPRFFVSPLETGLIAKAIETGTLQVNVHDLRRWAPEPHRKVDDEPFGGGAGMVMSAQPITAAVRSVAEDSACVIFLSPRGRPLTQELVRELSVAGQVVLVCGRYEGFDERAVQALEAQEVTVGDFVLTGGEAAALIVVEAVARLQPGYMGNQTSLKEESFSKGLLEYPQYTRPADFEGLPVPDVLVSGDHARIAKWRREQALRRTFEIRPELLEKADLTEEEKALIDSWRRRL